jgi:hypothetical protein
MCNQEPQCAAAVLMVRPAGFGFNPQTAASNAFQHGLPANPAIDIQATALREFDALAESLSRAGVELVIAEDTPAPAKPDAIFPNNWVSFHHDGTVVLYPMLAQNRRLERREEVLAQVTRQGAFRVVRTVDLSHHERDGKFLEGTGSLVLDRIARVAYASLSPRTDPDVLGEFAQQMHYELIIFETFDAGTPIYHTNVLMAVGTSFAVLCAELIPSPRRAAVLAKLDATGHELMAITPQQMRDFAGNLIELARAHGGGRIIALSTGAWRSLEPSQRRVLEKHGEIVAAEIPTIERLGGGGVRCTVAEIHLPHRAQAAGGAFLMS